jgi:uncharacterized protein
MNEFVKGVDGARILKLAGWALMILILFLAVQTLTSFKEWRGVNPAYNSISITGEGEIIAVPDVATFSFTVSADARNVSEAQAVVTGKMNTILKALKELGVEDRDIKTSDYSVWPKYRYESAPCSPTYCPPPRQISDGYTASHGVIVKVRKTEEAGQALAAAGDNGATNISGISFTVDDPEQVMAEARALAIADAKSKARTLSKDLGVRLVRVVNFYDSSNQYPPMPYGMGDERSFMKDMAQSAPTIPQGENKVKVSVTVVYEIR